MAAGHSRGRYGDNGEQVTKAAALALADKPSMDFRGYWQRHIAA